MGSAFDYLENRVPPPQLLANGDVAMQAMRIMNPEPQYPPFDPNNFAPSRNLNNIGPGEEDLMKQAFQQQALNPPSGFSQSMPSPDEIGAPSSPSNVSVLSSNPDSTSSNFPGLLYGIGLALGSAAGGARGDFSLPMNHLQLAQSNQHYRDLAEQRKQAFMQQQQQLDEAKRAHDMQMIERIIGSNLPSNTKMEQLKALGTQQASVLANGMKEADLANFKAFAPYIPQEVYQRFKNGTITPAEISTYVDLAKEEHKVNLKENVKSQKLAQAMDTPAEQRTPYQRLIVDQHMAEMENKKADTALKQANAQKALNPTANDHSDVARMMDAVHGVSWDQATQEQKQQILDMKQQKDLALARGRAEAQQQAALSVPDKPTSGDREKLAEDLAMIGRMDSLASMYNPEFIGPVRGRVGGLKEFFGKIGTDEASMRAEVATIKNQVIKMITGASMSVQEAGRIMSQLPDMTNSPEVFAARWKQTRDNMVLMAQKRRDIMQQTGIDLSRVAPLPGPSQAPASMDPIGSFQIQPNELDYARQLMQQGKTKEQVVQALQQRRTQ